MVQIYKKDDYIAFCLPLSINYMLQETKEAQKEHIKDSLLSHIDILIYRANEIIAEIKNKPDGFYNETVDPAHYIACSTLEIRKGVKWGITKEIYDTRLSIGATTDYKEGFTTDVSGKMIGCFTSYYYEEDGAYWHEYIEYIPQQEEEYFMWDVPIENR